MNVTDEVREVRQKEAREREARKALRAEAALEKERLRVERVKFEENDRLTAMRESSDEFLRRVGAGPKRANRLPKRWSIMAMDVQTRSAFAFWVKLEMSLLPVDALEKWLGYSDTFASSRRIFAPRDADVGTKKHGKGMTLSYEDRIRAFVVHHKVNLLLVGGPRGAWCAEKAGNYWNAAERDHWSVVEPEDFGEGAAALVHYTKPGCNRSLAAVTSLVKSCGWDEIKGYEG